MRSRVNLTFSRKIADFISSVIVAIVKVLKKNLAPTSIILIQIVGRNYIKPDQNITKLKKARKRSAAIVIHNMVFIDGIPAAAILTLEIL